MRCKNLTFDHVNITGGFWKEKQDMNRTITIWSVYKHFKETGRIDAAKLDWKARPTSPTGMPTRQNGSRA